MFKQLFQKREYTEQNERLLSLLQIRALFFHYCYTLYKFVAWLKGNAVFLKEIKTCADTLTEVEGVLDEAADTDCESIEFN